MRRFPRDADFNAAARDVVLGNVGLPKVYFFGTDNKILEVVGPSEIEDGTLAKMEARLRTSGRLKAILHAGIVKLSPEWMESYVQYLPDNRIYRLIHHQTPVLWLQHESYEDIERIWSQYHEKGEEEET